MIILSENLSNSVKRQPDQPGHRSLEKLVPVTGLLGGGGGEENTAKTVIINNISTTCWADSSSLCSSCSTVIRNDSGDPSAYSITLDNMYSDAINYVLCEVYVYFSLPLFCFIIWGSFLSISKSDTMIITVLYRVFVNLYNL